jgi:hypothetical protein
MPLFGGSKRPALTGLTKDEQKRRDALEPEITLRSSGAGQLSQGEALVQVLGEKAQADRGDFLWPLIAGWQLNSMRHFTAAIESFNDATSRDGKQVRTHCGAGYAYLQAGLAAQSLGSGITEVQVPSGMSTEALFHEAERCYATALGMTTDKAELAQLNEAATTVNKAIATTVKRMPGRI